MCGIAGIIGEQWASAPDALMGMIDSLVHRGPDARGEWRSPDGTVQLGHRRLSIVDLSAAGAQPMISPSGRLVIVFNGEIYNHLELRRSLESIGRAFLGHSDTEVLLVAIEEWGLERALQRAVGMFALGVWDRWARRLSLAVDRIGEKPLYFGWCKRTFLFGSELKALRAHPDWIGRLNPAAVAGFLRHGYVGGTPSIYEGIMRLQGGTTLSLGPEELDKGTLPVSSKYWSVHDALAAGQLKPFSANPTDAADELDRRLGGAVSMQMIADVPVGAFLSGGIDSSLIVAMMVARSKRPVRTFAIGFAEAAFDEAPHARRVAAHLGTDHTELIVSPSDALAVVPCIPEIYDEPFADPSQIPTFMVARLARQHVKVSLSGDAGDELFLGYRNYQHVRRLWGMVRRLPPAVRGWSATVLQRSTGAGAFGGDTTTKLRKLAKALPARSQAQMHQLMTTLDADDVMAPNVSLAPRTDQINEWEAYAATGLTQIGTMDLTTYLPGDVLVKVDRAAMAVSLETRIPFLDHRVVELALALPESLKVRGGVGKWILRRVLDRYVPRVLVERPKAGFAVPIAAWLRGPLREWADSLLSSRAIGAYGLLNAVSVRSRWDEHQRGVEDHHAILWNILMLQAWLENVSKPRSR